MNQEHYLKVRETIGNAQLCVVSKKHSIEEILDFYHAGERIFGENHADELVRKAKALPSDIQWQFIGHLQRNKVRSILPYTSCIQSLDSLKLAAVIEKEAARINRIQDVLVEFHLADEDTNKTGLSPSEADAFLEEVSGYAHIHVNGMMVMGPHTTDTARIQEVFLQAHSLFQDLQGKYGSGQFHILSMGMSADYQTAIQNGSTMVRIGTYLFTDQED